MDKYTHVIAYLYGTPWAVMPEKLTAILNFIDQKAEGMTFTKDELEGRFGALARPSARTQGSIAVIPVIGTIGQRMNMMSEFSGGTSVEKLTKQILSAADDPKVKAIVLDIDSPGGTVGGVPELSKVIFEARQKKHIIAQSNSLMASAAYWIGSAADEVVVTPSGEVGSIGVFTAHYDVSASHEMAGVKTTLISAGKFKVEGNPFEPLAADARDAIQSDVDKFYEMFVADVARNRGTGVNQVRNGFGQGRTVTAKDALKEGMVDRIATLDETLARLGATGVEFKDKRVELFEHDQQLSLAEHGKDRVFDSQTERKKLELLTI